MGVALLQSFAAGIIVSRGDLEAALISAVIGAGQTFMGSMGSKFGLGSSVDLQPAELLTPAPASSAYGMTDFDPARRLDCKAQQNSGAYPWAS